MSKESTKRAVHENVLQRIERLNKIGAALSNENDKEKVLELILLGAKELTNADGGSLYTVNEKGDQLEFKIVRTDSLNFAMGGTTGNPISFDPINLFHSDGTANDKMVAVYAAVHKKTINIPDAYMASGAGFDFSGTMQFDKKTGYRSQSFLTIPMLNHENEVIGVLQLINSIDHEQNEITAFSAEDQKIAESLASQAAISLSNQKLITQLKTLFESFVALIAQAIDEKSPYTGGHCRRVPVITERLAEAVSGASYGPYADFKQSDKDRYELKIAAMLHDCGKVTTPVHVVDKATKLETIFDRIHLVNARFEILKRDAKLALLEKKLAAHESGKGEELVALEEEYEAQIKVLNEDQAFLQHCNIGGEFMHDESQARVKDIAGYQWLDHNGQQQSVLSENEVYNLNIQKGTLTAEEREEINYHIVSTINMLKALPFPKDLQNVPEYAGGHHERMDGKGYPNGLTKEQMSVQARILGIADVFEALTAVDRPYKKGMPLSLALKILGNMAEEGHIDPDLLEVFVKEKVYLSYANDFLSDAQIDLD